MNDSGIFGRLAPRDAPSQSELTGPSVARSEQLMAAVAGKPRWTDSALQAEAGQAGPAAALLSAYRRYGDSLLAKISGHFAIVLFDIEAGKALFATDRFVTHPIAYSVDSSTALLVASRADTVARQPGVNAAISPQSIFNYTFFHMVPSPGTVYAGVAKLEPATTARFDGRNVRTQRYWMPRYPERWPSEAEIIERMQPILLRAVEAAEPGDASGAFLSGGLDSSTVVGMLAKVQPAKTFSIGFSEEGYDEMEYARTSARHFKTEPNEYYVQPADVAVAVPRIAAAYDEPFGNSSAVPTMFCARLAAQSGVTHLLAGDGGDELFGGNERYARQKVFERYSMIPQPLRKLLLEPLLRSPFGALPGIPGKMRSYAEQASVGMPMRLFTYNFVQHQGPAQIFSPSFLEAVSVTEPERLQTAEYQAPATTDIVDRMLYMDWKFVLADNDLRKVNTMCSLEGVKVSYPMLDDELLELSLLVSPELKVHGTELRYLYKRAMRGFLPDRILTKTKHGFGLPFGQWLKKSPPLQELVNDSLASFANRGFVRREFSDQIIAAHRSGQANFYGTFIWVLVLLEQWLAVHAPATRAP
ncbi:MAG: asparagine synthase [Proteobacteria bacterium]|nr:asparagine synthase [Pseudomonadota bacterium]